MTSRNNLKGKLSEIDLFGYTPQLLLNGKTSDGTPPGGICSIVLIMIYIVYFYTLIISMVTYDNLQTFETKYLIDDKAVTAFSKTDIVNYNSI